MYFRGFFFVHFDDVFFISLKPGELCHDLKAKDGKEKNVNLSSIVESGG